MNNLIKREFNFPVANTFFEDFFNKDWFDWSNKNFSGLSSTLPSANIKETDKAYEVELAAPGMQKDDFKVELNQNVLTISAEKKEEITSPEKKEEKSAKDEKGNYARREFNYQSFTRSFTLPDTVETEKIEAAYQDGILKIMIPKKATAKPQPVKTISVK